MLPPERMSLIMLRSSFWGLNLRMAGWVHLFFIVPMVKRRGLFLGFLGAATRTSSKKCNIIKTRQYLAQYCKGEGEKALFGWQQKMLFLQWLAEKQQLSREKIDYRTKNSLQNTGWQAKEHLWEASKVKYHGNFFAVFHLVCNRFYTLTISVKILFTLKIG